MFNFFKKETKSKGVQSQQMLLQHLAQKERIINAFIRKGLLSYNPANRRLFISTVLAQIYLNDEEHWRNFLRTMHQWALYHRQQEAWNQYFQNIEVAAVREARRKYASLSKAEVQRIRQEARTKVDITDLETPKTEPFEFIVADIETEANTSDLLVVGKFDGTNFEMEKFETVQRFLHQQ